MNKGRLGLLFLLVAVAILQACSKADVVQEIPDTIPLPEEVQSIAVFSRDDAFFMEHKDPEIINKLLQGMKAANPSHIGDPEQSGNLYEIVLTSGSESRTFTVNDLSGTNAPDVSAKLYAKLTGQDYAAAWSLPAEWIQLLLNSDTVIAKPELHVMIDEDSDSVMMTANRGMDRQSLEDAIASTLYVGINNVDDYPEYTISWTDDRRVVIRFPDLPEGKKVEFMPEGAKSADGEVFRVVSQQGSRAVAIHGGLAWSGLRLVDPSGHTVYEHGFDSAVLIQQAGFENGQQQFLIYNRNDITYLFNPGTRDISDISVREWAENEGKYRSDYGANVLYSYDADKNVLYAAKGLESIIRIDTKDGTMEQIYRSDRPIYGMAASPDGQFVALLVDAELNLGPYADLLILDSEGEVVSEFAKAAYSGHSDGWHFIYPVMWSDSETVAVPLIGSSAESFDWGKAFFHYKKGRLSAEPSHSMPEDIVNILTAELGGWDETQILRVLPRTDDKDERYYAVCMAGYGTYLVDREEKTADLIGSGALVGWTSEGQVVVWHSNEEISIVYLGIDL